MNRSRSLTISCEDMLMVTKPKERKTGRRPRHAKPSYSEVRDYKIVELEESSSSNSS